MKVVTLILNFISVWLRLLRPGDLRAVAAENIALRKQLITMSFHHKRAPKLTTIDSIIFGFLASMLSSKQLSRIAILIKPSALLKFHKALMQRKYQLLFSNKAPKKPGSIYSQNYWFCAHAGSLDSIMICCMFNKTVISIGNYKWKSIAAVYLSCQ